MRWYLAKIVYQIICGQGNHIAQFDEQLRLVTAPDEKKALEKATAIGADEQETFHNDKQQLVQWKFLNVTELYPLSALVDGAELYSRITEVSDADEYICMTDQKSRSLKDQYLTSYLPLNL